MLARISDVELSDLRRLFYTQEFVGLNPTVATIEVVVCWLTTLLCKQDREGSNPFGSTEL